MAVAAKKFHGTAKKARVPEKVAARTSIWHQLTKKRGEIYAHVLEFENVPTWLAGLADRAWDDISDGHAAVEWMLKFRRLAPWRISDEVAVQMFHEFMVRTYERVEHLVADHPVLSSLLAEVITAHREAINGPEIPADFMASVVERAKPIERDEELPLHHLWVVLAILKPAENPRFDTEYAHHYVTYALGCEVWPMPKRVRNKVALSDWEMVLTLTRQALRRTAKARRRSHQQPRLRGAA